MNTASTRRRGPAVLGRVRGAFTDKERRLCSLFFQLIIARLKKNAGIAAKAGCFKQRNTENKIDALMAPTETFEKIEITVKSEPREVVDLVVGVSLTGADKGQVREHHLELAL